MGIGDPFNKDYSIFGFILGSPYLGKLPCVRVPFSTDLQPVVLAVFLLQRLSFNVQVPFGTRVSGRRQDSAMPPRIFARVQNFKAIGYVFMGLQG